MVYLRVGSGYSRFVLQNGQIEPHRIIMSSLHQAALCLSLALASASWATALEEPVIATYDASGSSPQCSQGRESYMRDCVFGSDFYFYVVAGKPAFGPRGWCGYRCFSRSFMCCAR